MPLADVVPIWWPRLPIAGPVFTEWYWGPIFLAIVYGPPILATAGILYALTRRRPEPRGLRALAALAVASVLVIGGAHVWRTVRFERTEAAQARTIAFGLFEPDGFDRRRTEVYDGLWPSVHWTYERDGRTLFASQHSAREDDVTPPQCSVHTGTRFSAFSGACRAARTPQGRTVTLAETPDMSLLAVVDGTLIVAGSHEATEDDLLAYGDALAPVAPGELDFER